MSKTETASLPPSYRDADLARALAPPRPLRRNSFVKQSKKGELTLQLIGQDENGSLPAYGYGALVEGVVNVEKGDGVQTVQLRVRQCLLARSPSSCRKPR